MMIFNLLIFVSLRDRAFVSYVFYVLSMLLAQLSLQGHLGAALEYPSQDWPRRRSFSWPVLCSSRPFSPACS